MRRILQGYYRLPGAGDGWIAAGLLAALRLWLAWPFFHTGMLRVERWSTQTFLFGDIHPLPGVDPWIAALLTTTAELTLPVLLAVGLAGRLAGFPAFRDFGFLAFRLFVSPAIRSLSKFPAVFPEKENP